LSKALSIQELNFMKRVTTLLVFFLSLIFTSQIGAQDGNSRVERVQKMRQQLIDIQAREAELRARLDQLNEALQPENIEREMAGVGSTHPEELREHRRRQLTIEKNNLLSQLNNLADDRQQLESAISIAESEGYVPDAQASPAASTQMFIAQNVHSSLWVWLVMLPAAVIVLAIVGGAALILLRRRSA
jgi:DNA-directed RNA polymerase